MDIKTQHFFQKAVFRLWDLIFNLGIISVIIRVAQSTDTKMDSTNLARVFGPTIVGHAVPDPDPMTILQDTKRQPKVSAHD